MARNHHFEQLMHDVVDFREQLLNDPNISDASQNLIDAIQARFNSVYNSLKSVTNEVDILQQNLSKMGVDC